MFSGSNFWKVMNQKISSYFAPHRMSWLSTTFKTTETDLSLPTQTAFSSLALCNRHTELQGPRSITHGSGGGVQDSRVESLWQRSQNFENGFNWTLDQFLRSLLFHEYVAGQEFQSTKKKKQFSPFQHRVRIYGSQCSRNSTSSLAVLTLDDHWMISKHHVLCIHSEHTTFKVRRGRLNVKFNFLHISTADEDHMC